jgi:uncharacterized tellurite resistance protein B-like protein
MSLRGSGKMTIYEFTIKFRRELKEGESLKLLNDMISEFILHPLDIKEEEISVKRVK